MTFNEYTREILTKKPNKNMGEWCQRIFDIYRFNPNFVYRIEPIGSQAIVNLYSRMSGMSGSVLQVDECGHILITDRPLMDSEMMMLGLELEFRIY